MIAFTIKNETTENVPVEIKDLVSGGYANGYVAVLANSKYYNVDYNEINVEIHGGLTFSQQLTGKEIKKYADKITVGAGKLDLNQKYWVIGFDTKHMMDSLTTCPKEYCEHESISLYKQLTRSK